MKRVKTGGRTKGAKNRYTYATKEIMSDIVNNEMQHLSESLQKMTDIDRANIIIKLLPYVVSRDSMPDDIVYTLTLGK